MSENILSENDYKQILYRYFNHNDVKLVSYNIKPLSELVQGFIGDHYKIDITCEIDGEEKVKKFFLKTRPTKTNAQKELVSDLNVYPQEIFLYDVLLREFEKYGFDTSFAPKCYYCIADQSLILEDITLRGFSVPELYKFYDLEQCKCGLRSLALLHAAGYMYEEVKTKELGRRFRWNVEHAQYLANELFYSKESKSFGLRWLKSVRDSFVGLIDVLPENEDYKEEFKKRLREVELGNIFYEEHNIRKTIGHGDLWSNNMMFKSENGVAQQCCLLDYQLVRYYYPAFDVILFIYTNTTREFRKNHWAELSIFYYSTLSDILSKHGYCIDDIYPEEDYKNSLRIVELEPKMHGLGVQTYMCYSEKRLSDMVNSGTDDIKEMWFGDRAPYLIKYCKSNEAFRNIMIDCMYDLHDVLFKN